MSHIELILNAVLQEHKKMQKLLRDDNPTTRRMAFEALFVFDNRAFGLIVGSAKPNAQLEDWFDLVANDIDK